MLDTAIRMEPDIAKQHYLDYLHLKKEHRTAEDEEIQKSYLELSRGRAIINATEAVKVAGLDEKGRPRIAFCRASAPFVHLRTRRGEIEFLDKSGAEENYRSGRLIIPCSESTGWQRARTVVPPVPPAHRPDSRLDRYWIMWEVEDWEDVPSDPALLRRLNQTTFSVLAVWDLTEVERMVLRGRSDA